MAASGDLLTDAYVRLYASTDGESHFEDVALASTMVTHTSGAVTAVSDLVPADGLIFRRVVEDVGGDIPADFHVAPYPVFIITLSGTAEVTASDGETRIFGPGSVVLVEDTTGRGHITVPVGDGPRVTLFAPAQRSSGYRDRR
jgi:quercetin dioxygenase-like cupin family protein